MNFTRVLYDVARGYLTMLAQHVDVTPSRLLLQGLEHTALLRLRGQVDHKSLFIDEIRAEKSYLRS